MPAVRRTSATRARDIASSDDDIPVIVASRTVARSPARSPSKKRKQHVVPEPQKWIEIFSSDEETQPQKLPPRDQVKDLRRELRKRSSKLATVEAELERARKEISELKQASKSFKKGLFVRALGHIK
jgi:molecular chaperone GrpE (heat shock protein)